MPQTTINARRAAENAEHQAEIEHAAAFLGVTRERAAFIVANVGHGTLAHVQRWVQYLTSGARRDDDAAETAELAIRWHTERERMIEAALAARAAAPQRMTRAERNARIDELIVAQDTARAAGDRDLVRSISREIDALETA